MVVVVFDFFLVAPELALGFIQSDIDSRVHAFMGYVNHHVGIVVNMDNDLRIRLKKEGFLTRDPREKERKKYGQKGVRKRFQFSKR